MTAEDKDLSSERQQVIGSSTAGQGDYVVKDGDCISSIALEHGHFWKTIWKHPANAELRQIRQDPNMLMPGDRVHVTPISTKTELGASEMCHRFKRKGEPAKMVVRVLMNDRPLANLPYQLDVDGNLFLGTSDAEGGVAVSIPGNARRAKLRIGLAGREREYLLELGGMDPVSEVSGIQRRLNNLGFSCGSADNFWGPVTESALERFQERHGLPITGQPDEATRAKLKEVHGS